MNSSIIRSINRYKNNELTESEINELNRLLKLTEKLIYHKDNSKFNSLLIDKCDNLGVKVIQDLPHIALSYYLATKGSQEIHISKNPIPCVFAHEIGHAIAYNTELWKPEKLSSNLYAWSNVLTYLLRSLSFILGMSITASKNPIKSAAIVGMSGMAASYLMYKPVLHQENFASKTAIQLLTDMGATKEYLMLSSATLKAAYKTYSSSGVANMVLTGTMGSIGSFIKVQGSK